MPPPFLLMTVCYAILNETRGRTLGRNRDKSLIIFPSFYSQAPLLTDYTPLPPWAKVDCLKLPCKINIVKGNHKPENSQDYAQKPQRNCTFMNSASGWEVSIHTVKNNMAPCFNCYHIQSVCSLLRYDTFEQHNDQFPLGQSSLPKEQCSPRPPPPLEWRRTKQRQTVINGGLDFDSNYGLSL